MSSNPDNHIIDEINYNGPNFGIISYDELFENIIEYAPHSPSVYETEHDQELMNIIPHDECNYDDELVSLLSYHTDDDKSETVEEIISVTAAHDECNNDDDEIISLLSYYTDDDDETNQVGKVIFNIYIYF